MRQPRLGIYIVDLWRPYQGHRRCRAGVRAISHSLTDLEESVHTITLGWQAKLDPAIDPGDCEWIHGLTGGTCLAVICEVIRDLTWLVSEPFTLRFMVLYIVQALTRLSYH